MPPGLRPIAFRRVHFFLGRRWSVLRTLMR